LLIPIVGYLLSEQNSIYQIKQTILNYKHRTEQYRILEFNEAIDRVNDTIETEICHKDLGLYLSDHGFAFNISHEEHIEKGRLDFVSYENNLQYIIEVKQFDIGEHTVELLKNKIEEATKQIEIYKTNKNASGEIVIFLYGKNSALKNNHIFTKDTNIIIIDIRTDKGIASKAK
jgi:hypothetical protein